MGVLEEQGIDSSIGWVNYNSSHAGCLSLYLWKASKERERHCAVNPLSKLMILLLDSCAHIILLLQRKERT